MIDDRQDSVFKKNLYPGNSQRPGNNRITNCIYYNMSFPTFNQFPPIEPRFFRRFRRSFNRLGVNDPGAWILITTHFFAKASDG